MSENHPIGDPRVEMCAPAATVVVFFLDGQRYALPLDRVDQVLPMVWVSALPEAPAIVMGVVNLHGYIVPVLDIRCRFGLPPRAWGLTAQLIVVQLTRYRVALPVDEVVGVMAARVTVVPWSSWLPADIHPLTGIVSLADDLLFVCNLDAFLSGDEQQQLTVALEAVGP